MLKILLFCLLVNQSTSAYLDPASGSILMYVIISMLAAFIYSFNSVFQFIYNFVSNKLLKRKIINDELVIYSEGKQYWLIFKPIVDELINRKIKFSYYCSSKDDPGLSYNSELMKPRYIGKPIFASMFLNVLKAKMVLMTTPQLDVMNLKRSKYVSHYGHILHAPVDVHSYRKFAFDYFDSVFCTGSHQFKSIRFLEESRGVKSKDLFMVGFSYYDNFKNITFNNKENSILIAPTWKEYSLIHKFGYELIGELLRLDYHVILRPHPQTYISYPDVIDKIVKAYSINKKFTIDRSNSLEFSLNNSFMMISDLSGVIWDYMFLGQKPVLLFDTPSDLKGYESTDINHKAWEREVIDKYLMTFNESDILNISNILKNIKNIDVNLINSIVSSSVYNFKNSSNKIVDNIVVKLEELND